MRIPVGGGWGRVMLQNRIFVAEKSMTRQLKRSRDFGPFWTRRVVGKAWLYQSVGHVSPLSNFSTNLIQRALATRSFMLSKYPYPFLSLGENLGTQCNCVSSTWLYYVALISLDERVSLWHISMWDSVVGGGALSTELEMYSYGFQKIKPKWK